MTTTTTKKPAKPATVNLLFGHCATGRTETLPDGRQHHPLCPGSGKPSVDQLAFCTCECHQVVPRCSLCLTPDVDLMIEGTCIDAEACGDRLESKHQASPVHQQIASIQADLDVQREIERQEAAATRPAPPVRERRAPAVQRCQCGCGAMTKGGKFVAGHDAKLKGILLRYARGETTGTNGSGQVKAAAELIARDWPRKGVDTKVLEKADALVDEYGVDRVIDVHVAARYGDK